MKYESTIESFKAFSDSIATLLCIKNEADYQKALDLMDELFEVCEDKEGDPVSPFIDLVAASIERYENQDPELVDFITRAEKIPKDIALVNVLIDQHKLTLSDLPEIGDKSTVSRFLNEKRALTKPAIVKLCQRFNLRPDMFFNY